MRRIPPVEVISQCLASCGAVISERAKVVNDELATCRLQYGVEVAMPKRTPVKDVGRYVEEEVAPRVAKMLLPIFSMLLEAEDGNLIL